MKKSTKLLLLTFVVTVLSLYSCSTEETLIQEDAIEVNSKETSILEMQVVVVYHPGKSEAQKAEIREEYLKTKVLIKFVVCDDDPDKEIWTIGCTLCNRDSDVPIKTDPCETEETEECDLKRAYWGNRCDL